MTTVERTPNERATRLVHRRSALNSAVAIASLAAVVTGCTAPSHLSPGADSISVAVRFVNGSGNPILAHDRPEDASLLLGAIAGAIAGRPKGTLQTVRIAELPTIGINLSNLSAAIEQEAATMTRTAAGAGLQITPADTKFARASTFLKWRGPPSGLHITFVDSDDSSNLTLVFFDRPCRLTGMVKQVNPDDKATIVFDVTIEKAGLSWLVTTSTGSTESVMHAAPASTRPTLVIRPATT
jgi:hypothetical protein